MKRFAICSALLLLAACGGKGALQNPDPNHTHADFAMWINGTQVDFAQDKYMSGLSTDEHTHDEEGEYHDKYLHLHDHNGHVLHSHKPGLTIGQFFTSLGITITQSCITMDTGKEYCSDGGINRWRFFVNGTERPLDPGYVFADLDHLLFTYGATPAQIDEQQQAMTDDACMYSQTCPERGKPPTENCIADPAVPCVAPLE